VKDLQYRCGTQVRRQKALGSPLNGIDYLEVAADQVQLHVHFLNPIVGSLTPANVVIDGGVRIKGIRVTNVAVAAADNQLLEVTTSAAGDFSIYTLRLQKGIDDPTTLDGYDQVLSNVPFSFRAACPSDFDCLLEQVCAEAALPSPVIDYLSKDYASFRRLMLDRLAVTMPDWTERNPADLLVTLVELLAYVGDDLSYRQDVVAAEVYLGTCRRRTSARRHARLLDYHVHEGCNARTWIHFETPHDELVVPQGTKVVSGVPDQQVHIADLDAITEQSIAVFETMHPLKARRAHNRIGLWTWGDLSCCLPEGATAATLVAAPGMALGAGDLLLLEEASSPKTGRPADADPTHRQVVRLIGAVGNVDNLYGLDVVDVQWGTADALTFPLCVSAEITDPTNVAGGTVMAEVAVARANVVLADHGRTLRAEPPLPETVPQEGAFLPTLRRNDLTFALALTKADLQAPASVLATTDPRKALPAVTLTSPAGVWVPRYDLLDSDRFSLDFVVEMEDDRVAHLRFGDDVHGRQPIPGHTFSSIYRVGSSTGGNIGREALRRVVGVPGVDVVRNPLPAAGGQDPELLEAIKQLAPQAFRRQDRAVTEADYGVVARRHPEVLNAAARMRWTGSWWTVFLTVERRGGPALDLGFRHDLADFVDQFRLAGYDVEVEGPIYVPLDIGVAFCTRDGFFAEDVRQAIVAALTGRAGSRTAEAFFAPDRFTFGQSLYLSQVYAAVLAVPGVASVAVTRFQRWGKLANQELENGRLTVAPLEVVQLANDPNFPENGRLDVALGGAA
jgi:hypothetical protein